MMRSNWNKAFCVHSVREFMAFTSEVLAQRTSTGERRTVKEQGSPRTQFILSMGVSKLGLVVNNS